MDRWAHNFLELLKDNKVTVFMLKTYVDDVNLVIQILRKGCFWEKEQAGTIMLKWSKEREEQDELANKDDKTRTMELLLEASNVSL